MRWLVTAAVFTVALSAAGYAQPRGAANGGSGLSYTKTQADQGKALYSKYCSSCHLQDLKGKCSEDLDSTSYVCAAPGSAPPLVGPAFHHRYASVGDLYSRVRWTMPADKKYVLSPVEDADVVAYLLEANGVPAGSTELKPDLDAMKAMVFNTDRGSSAKVTEPLNSLGISQGYYTDGQAERGKAYFYAACGICHTADPKSPHGTVERSTGLGWHYADVNSYALYFGNEWLATASGIPGRPQRWDTVANLYNKIRTTQPAYDVAGLSTQEYLDILAYLLKQSGLPAGNQELKHDLNQMRNMTLEKGFERLFNGKDFTGWAFVVGPNCAPQPEGCGQSTPAPTYKVGDGIILDTGSPHGYAYAEQKFMNFDLRVEYRFLPYPGMESDDDLYTNTGYLLYITKPDVWPRTLEIQGKTNFEMSIAMGSRDSTFTFDDEARARARKPVGQWNSIEIVAKDGQVWTYLNGALVTHVTKHPFASEPGYIGFQAESGPVEWRNIRIKPE